MGIALTFKPNINQNLELKKLQCPELSPLFHYIPDTLVKPEGQALMFCCDQLHSKMVFDGKPQLQGGCVVASYEKETYRTTLGDYCAAKGLNISQIAIEALTIHCFYFGIFNGRAYKKARAQFDKDAARFEAVVDFGEGATFQPEKSWMNFFFNIHSEGYQMRGTGIVRKV